MTAKKASFSNIKQLNRNAIYRFLYKNKPQSKQDLAYELKMSLPTVGQNIKELIQLDLIHETGEFESTGGRKARALEVNNSARYAIGLDITQNHIGCVIINLGCEIIFFKRYRKSFHNRKSDFKAINDIVLKSIAQTNINPDLIIGVGIAVPAIISSDNQKIEFCPILDFTGGTKEAFAEFISFPIKLCNDANAAGFCELWNTTKRNDLLYLSLSNSVGGAVLFNGNLYPGENQRAGELGHMSLFPNGTSCYCGKKGCVDAYCNAKILSTHANNHLETFFQKLAKGHPEYKKIWNKYLDDLAIIINNLRMVFDSDIVLGGYVGSFMEQYLLDLRQRVAQKNTFENDGNYLEVCTFKFQATAVGAALYHISQYIETI